VSVLRARHYDLGSRVPLSPHRDCETPRMSRHVPLLVTITEPSACLVA